MDHDATLQRPVLGDDTDRSADRRVIEQVIADVERAFNGNDPVLAVEHFAADATVVNALGSQISGWDALLATHEQAFEGFLKDEHAHYRLAELTFLGPDVAVAHKHAFTADPDGRPTAQEPAMIAQYVLVRRGDRWWVAARANVLTSAG